MVQQWKQGTYVAQQWNQSTYVVQQCKLRTYEVQQWKQGTYVVQQWKLDMQTLNIDILSSPQPQPPFLPVCAMLSLAH